MFIVGEINVLVICISANYQGINEVRIINMSFLLVGYLIVSRSWKLSLLALRQKINLKDNDCNA